MSSALHRRLRAGLAVAAVVVLTGCGGATAADGGSEHADHGAHEHSSDGAPALVEGPDDTYAGNDLLEPFRRPAFTLTDTTGAAYDFKAETGGRPTLLFFGYTDCPDICPTTMADIALALRGLDREVAEQVEVVFVTTDPVTDTPEVLGEYLDRFDADLPTSFVGLTGDQEAIHAAQLSAGVTPAEDEGRTHSSMLLLYGSDDAAHVNFDAANTAQDIAADLALVTGA